jgi:hypothetical protein
LSNWTDNIEDIVQEVFSKRLSGRNQAQYIRDTAANLSEFRAILTNEVKITIELLRVPNQTDNIWENLKQILQAKGWAEPNTSMLNEAEEQKLVQKIMSLPRLRNRGTERLSPLFARGTLEKLAQAIVDEFSHAVEKDLIRCLRSALTIISPGLSIRVEDPYAEEFLNSAKEALSSEAEHLESELVDYAVKLLNSLSLDEQEIMVRRANGESLEAIANVLGTTRYLATSTMNEMKIKVAEFFKGLDLEQQNWDQVLVYFFSLMGYQQIDGRYSK